MLRKEQNTAQRAKNNAVILPSGEEKPQSANVGKLGEPFYVSSIPSEHNEKIVNEQWQNVRGDSASSLVCFFHHGPGTCFLQVCRIDGGWAAGSTLYRRKDPGSYSPLPPHRNHFLLSKEIISLSA